MLALYEPGHPVPTYICQWHDELYADDRLAARCNKPQVPCNPVGPCNRPALYSPGARYNRLELLHNPDALRTQRLDRNNRQDLNIDIVLVHTKLKNLLEGQEPRFYKDIILAHTKLLAGQGPRFFVFVRSNVPE